MQNKPLSRLSNAISHGNIWLYVLSLMKREKVYAYTLPEKINEKFGFSPSRLMTYFVLYKLKKEGLIKSYFSKRRKYYKLTSEGKKSLENAKKTLISLGKKL